MDIPKLDAGSVWHRGGKRFVVVRSDETTKDADAANWQRSVAYQDIEAMEPVRNRTVDDFLGKFTADADNA